MSKWVLPMLALSFVFSALSASPAHAQVGRTMPRMSTASTTRSTNVDLACVGTAVTARESAITAAAQTYGTAFGAAFTARTAALTTAYAMSEPASAREAVKTAWSTYRSAMKEARSAWGSARVSAWRTFRTAAAACKAPRGTDDGANVKIEESAL